MTIELSELEVKVDGLGDIHKLSPIPNKAFSSLDNPFNEALVSLNFAGIKYPITARELAYARIQKGKNSSLCKNGNYTKEGFLYTKNEPYLLALNSPLLDLELARQAVEANIKGIYFATSNEVYKQYREIAENEKTKEPEKRNALIVTEKESFNIPTNKFNENDLTRFLFKDQSENYGKFLRENNIDEIQVLLVDKNYVDSQIETILTQLWFYDLDRSALSGYDKNLDYNCCIRGLKP